MTVNLLVQVEYDTANTNEEDVADAVEVALVKSLNSTFITLQEVIILQDDINIELEDEPETDMN
jgi:hypothetical protein